MASIFYLVLPALVTVVICGDQDFLKGFTFKTAKNHGCYQIYNSTDQVDALTGWKSHKREKVSCALALQDDESHCEIRTPSNESIIVSCYEAQASESSDPNQKIWDTHYTKRNQVECYMVRKGQEAQEVCPKLIDKDTAAITTPDNYTLILKGGKFLSTLLADREFVSNFTFDPSERSCYKVFTAQQKISEDTCSDRIESTMACVHEWDENPNCTVLITPNNETVVVDCQGRRNTGKNCVEVHMDGNSTEVCMEELEESCMGITTPSGLRLPFACRICQFKGKIYSYDKVKLKKQREFVKKLLEKHEYYKHKFEVWNDHYKYKSSSKQSIYPYWLPNTTCYGFELDTNETVIIQCTDRKFKRKDCFKIIEPNEKDERDICATVPEETCAVIDTPKEKRVFIGCFNALEYRIKTFLNSTLKAFKNGNYIYTQNSQYKEMYRRGGAYCHTERVSYEIRWLNKNCGGIVTNDLEVIVLQCTYYKRQHKTGCFPIYTQKYGPDGQILPRSYKKDQVCTEVIDDNCVGIITPKGWAVQFNCFIRDVEHGGSLFQVKPKEPITLF